MYARPFKSLDERNLVPLTVPRPVVEPEAQLPVGAELPVVLHEGTCPHDAVDRIVLVVQAVDSVLNLDSLRMLQSESPRFDRFSRGGPICCEMRTECGH